MNANRNSDESVVPATSANNEAIEASAEPNEERDSTKRNVEQTDMLRTQGRDQRVSFGLHGVREAAHQRFHARLKVGAVGGGKWDGGEKWDGGNIDRAGRKMGRG